MDFYRNSIAERPTLPQNHEDSRSTIALDGRKLWGYVVETGEAMHIQLSIDDWERMGLVEGQRIPVRLPDRADLWLYVQSVTALPPIVWVVMVRRLRVVG